MTASVSPADRAAEVGEALARVTAPGRVAIDGLATGGMSQETWLVTVEQDGQSTQAVLRLPTPGSGSRSIVTQRIALQLASEQALPVPGLIAFDDAADNPFRMPFLLMERAVGEIPGGWSRLELGRRQRIGRHAMRVLADLHRVDVAQAGARGLRRPKTSAAAEELAYYRRRFADLGLSTRGTVEVAFRWLEAHLPVGDDLVVVHNDFRMGNFVVTGDEVSAVLDWELSALGHPLADLTWCFIAVWEIVDVDLGEMFAAYEDAAGRRVDTDEARFFTALGYLRLLYYGLSGGAAFLGGGSPDLRQVALRLLTPLRIDRLLSVIAGDPVT